MTPNHPSLHASLAQAPNLASARGPIQGPRGPAPDHRSAQAAVGRAASHGNAAPTRHSENLDLHSANKKAHHQTPARPLNRVSRPNPARRTSNAGPTKNLPHRSRVRIAPGKRTVPSAIGAHRAATAPPAPSTPAKSVLSAPNPPAREASAQGPAQNSAASPAQNSAAYPAAGLAQNQLANSAQSPAANSVQSKEQDSVPGPVPNPASQRHVRPVPKNQVKAAQTAPHAPFAQENLSPANPTGPLAAVRGPPLAAHAPPVLISS